MEPTFEKLLVRLARADIKFLLVGGIAVSLNGYVRLTEDVDILVESSGANISRLLKCLSSYGEGFARELRVQDFDEEEGAIRIIEESEECQIDVFTVMSGKKYEELASDAECFSVEDVSFLYASKKVLIDLKSGSVREKDQLDVLALRKLESESGNEES